MPTVHLLGNPTAGVGRGDRVIPSVAAAIRARGHDVVELPARRRDEVTEVLGAALDDGATRVVLVGGDGLAHLATQVLAGTPTVLGMIPVGTGNDFARALGLTEDDIDAAVGDALGVARPMDALRTTRGWVASVATLGFSGAVNARANGLRRPRGGARYTVATLLELPRLRAQRLHLDLDGQGHEVDATLVAVANTAYFGGGMAICPDADPTDGRLDVAIVGAVGRITMLRFLPTVFSGRHVTHPAVTMLSGRTLRIARDTPGDDGDAASLLWGDGERVGALPLTIEVVPGALQVAAPLPKEARP
jgi:diacylglycerol kinase (ATP)